MSRSVCLIDVPGLSRGLLDAVPSTSALGKWIASQPIIGLTPTWPAVTCSIQATLTTGVTTARHGIVSNGVATYRSREDRQLIDASSFASYRCEVSFWEQSNQFLEAHRFWQDPATGRSRCKTAMLFFQHSMPGFVEPLKPAADVVITPKPEHGPDGKITSLLWTEPRDLAGALFEQLGPFPLMNFWGPMAGIESSRWIARAAAWVWDQRRPQLQLVYVPHLDYDLQRFGPDSPQARNAVAEMAAALEPLLEAVTSTRDAQVVLLSEYAMHDVSRFVQPNRMLADAGLLRTRDTPDGMLVDYERSAAFAMVDHQIAHVYARDPEKAFEVLRLFEAEPDLQIHLNEGLLAHRRAGDLLLKSSADAWFDYRWWSDPAEAPAFAKDVDIHRKPGYDPLELFFDAAIRGVSQDPSRVRGSHGRAAKESDGIVVGASSAENGSWSIPAERVAGIVAAMLGLPRA